MSDKKSCHLLGVDMLRGAAVLLVVVYHAFGAVYGFYVPWNRWWRDVDASPSITLLWCYPISWAWSGVALFFVLSGFCIHLSYLRSPSFSVQRFFWQRFWRIYPAYLLALIAFALLERVKISSAEGLRQIVCHVLFVHNLWAGTFFGINPSFWSIATEVQLYCAFPLLLFVRRRLGIKACLVLTMVLGMLWRAFAVHRWGLPEHLINVPFSFPIMTWFDWTLGAYVAEQFACSQRAFHRPYRWLAVLFPMFVFSTFYKPLTSLSFSFAAVISAVVVDLTVWTEFRHNFVTRCLVGIGVMSYSIYLWHQPLLYHLLPNFERFMHPFAAFAGVAACIGILAAVSYAAVERWGIVLGRVLSRFVFGRQGLGESAVVLRNGSGKMNGASTGVLERR